MTGEARIQDPEVVREGPPEHIGDVRAQWEKVYQKARELQSIAQDLRQLELYCGMMDEIGTCNVTTLPQADSTVLNITCHASSLYDEDVIESYETIMRICDQSNNITFDPDNETYKLKASYSVEVQ